MSGSHRVIGAGILVLLVSQSTASVATGDDDVPSVLRTPFQCLECWNADDMVFCTQYPAGTAHEAYPADLGTWSGEPHPCSNYGVCEDYHSTCRPKEDEDELDMEELRQALLFDSKALRELVAAHPTRIQINRERSAMQLRNCAGRFVAHILLSGPQLQLLTDH
ncbi:MAG TPA: hypothetical protein VMN60_12595 [Longimicrobiales bacterium]|nr:hypothetical protein [Longimicrobiales bacterium]